MTPRPLNYIFLLFAFITLPNHAEAYAPKPTVSHYEVVSYCNEEAVKRFYAVLNERYSNEHVPDSEQYSILDKQFNNCLHQAGYTLKRESDTNVNLNFMFN